MVFTFKELQELKTEPDKGHKIHEKEEECMERRKNGRMEGRHAGIWKMHISNEEMREGKERKT